MAARPLFFAAVMVVAASLPLHAETSGNTTGAAPPEPPKGYASPSEQQEEIVWAHMASQFIKQFWTIPEGTFPPHRITRVKLSFTANGTLQEYRMTRSSRNMPYDEAALKAVALAKARGALPMGPPPTNGTFQFSIDFNSKERPQ